MNCGIVWFRRDLRLSDHPALERAVQSHDALLLVYIDDDTTPYSASRAWLRHSLRSLGDDIASRGGQLHVLAGDPEVLIPRLAHTVGASAVHVSALNEPAADARDGRIAKVLARDRVAMRRAGGGLLTDPDQIRTKSDAPFRVFTPFLKAALPTWRYQARAAPRHFTTVGLPDELAGTVTSIDAPSQHWDHGFWQAWSPGEASARLRLHGFLPRLEAYPADRDLPALDGTSRLSPHLHFGEISAGAAFEAARAQGGGADKFVAELGWREFAHYVLHHWPHSADRNFNPRFDAMEWREDPQGLEAWRHGRTGVPLVDAGMRQLWQEGWMHNRVRMVVASWLTKHLGIHWREGAAWFMNTLVDADTANNALGWQWVAGTGVDASPYYRIFNPVAQSRKFDPGGDYLRRWLPELAMLDDVAIHAPWEAGGVPKDYPRQPHVGLAAGRMSALARFRNLS